MEIKIDFLKKSILSVKLTSQFAGKFPLHVTLNVAVLNGCTFVVHFFTFTDSKGNLYASVLQVKIQRNEGAAFFFYTAGEPFDFFCVQKKLFRPVRVVVKYRRKRIFRNMEILYPNLAIYNFCKCVRK